MPASPCNAPNRSRCHIGHWYLAAVQADPNAPYLLRRGSDVERTFMMHAAATGQRYQVAYSVGSYTVYVAE